MAKLATSWLLLGLVGVALSGCSSSSGSSLSNGENMSPAIGGANGNGPSGTGYTTAPSASGGAYFYAAGGSTSGMMGAGGATYSAGPSPTYVSGVVALGGSSSAPATSALSTASDVVSPPPVTVPGVNPFVLAAHDPFSTFGADVDTASYDVFRLYARQGTLPPATGVRLEEYVNYFSYDYPAPAVDGPHPFYISLAAAQQVFDRPTTLLRVGIQATNPPPYTKKPANLVFLLDVSGSMDDPVKLPLIKTMMVQALDVLDPTDTVAVVTYSDTATVRLTPTPVSSRQTIVNVIDGLFAGGSTAGADGMGLAYQQATNGFIPGGINHIVMCTDGDFNVGPSSTSELLTLIRQKRQTGVTLTVLGFGSGNLNDAMMESVADAGNGIYSVIIDGDHAQQYVRNKLLATIVHVAKDMKIQVEFNPDLVYAYRLLGYEDRDIADANFRNDTIDAGEVGAGHRVTALYELVLTGGTIPSRTGAPTPEDGPPSTLAREIATTDLALVKVRYKAVDATDLTPALEVSTTLPADAPQAWLDVADQDLRWATAVAALAEILKGSPYADKTFLPAIRSICAAQATRDADRQEFDTLLEKIVPLL
jgi:Ca-activated chloride channel family protein